MVGKYARKEQPENGKALTSFTPAQFAALEEICITESRNRSDVIRMAVNEYVRNAKLKHLELVNAQLNLKPANHSGVH